MISQNLFKHLCEANMRLQQSELVKRQVIHKKRVHLQNNYLIWLPLLWHPPHQTQRRSQQ